MLPTSPIMLRAIADARAANGRLIRVPAGNLWASPFRLQREADAAPRYPGITVGALVTRGIAVFTKFGTRSTRVGLVPTELELLDTPTLDPDTERPTIPSRMLDAASLWKQAMGPLREAAAAIRATYPAHSTVPFRDLDGRQQTYGRMLRHDAVRMRCHVQTATGRVVVVPYVDILRAVLGGRFESPALDSDP